MCTTSKIKMSVLVEFEIWGHCFLGLTSGDLSWPLVNFLKQGNSSYSIPYYLTSLENYAQGYKHYPKSKNFDYF